MHEPSEPSLSKKIFVPVIKLAFVFKFTPPTETTSVLFSDPSKYYVQNRTLDANHDKAVTKFEAASQVRAELVKGAQYSG